MKKIFPFVFLCLILTGSSYAQQPGQSTSGQLQYSESFLPDDLLNTSAVAFIHIAQTPAGQPRPAWQELAGAAQPFMKAVGVDPVMYFYLDDVVAGPDVTKALVEQWTSRGVRNIIILSEIDASLSNTGTRQYALYVIPFSGDYRLAEPGGQAFKITDSSIDRLFRRLARVIDQKDLEMENLLITEHPEIFSNIQVIKGRRHEEFVNDLRIDKLAVPKATVERPIPIAMVEANNGRHVAGSENVIIESLMSDYPYQYGFVDYNYDEEQMRKAGHQYVLMRLHTTAYQLRLLLGYEVDPSGGNIILSGVDDEGALDMKPVAPDMPVYKYYVKHIYTGDVYLGTHWDASPNWPTAMQNFLYRLKAALETKQ